MIGYKINIPKLVAQNKVRRKMGNNPIHFNLQINTIPWDKPNQKVKDLYNENCTTQK